MSAKIAERKKCAEAVLNKPYDKKSDCPTAAPDQRYSAVKMVQQCGIDLISLIDSLGVPPEFMAVVMVRTDITPNSGATWGQYTAAPQCEQMFFFDTRRTVSDLEDEVSIVMHMNHTMVSAPATLPAVERVVPRDVAEQNCACGRRFCAGREYRGEILRRRFGRTAALPNMCPITSCNYDKILAETVPEKEGDALSVPMLSNWHLYDEVSRFPILPETDESNSNDYVTLARTVWRSPRFESSVHEQVLHATTNEGVPVRSFLTLDNVNVANILRRRQRSVHCTPLCFKDCSTMCEKLIGGTYNLRTAMRETLDDAQSRDSEEFVAQIEKRMPPSTRNAEADRAVFDTLRDKDCAKHAYGCTCIVEAFLRKRCTRQMSLVLVPTPVNNVYRVVGDSVFHIDSPLMRKLAAVGCLSGTLNEDSDDEDEDLKGIVLEENAERGDLLHYDTVIVNNPPLQHAMRAILGSFECTAETKTIAFKSTDGAIGRRQHAFVDYADRLRATNRQKFGTVMAPECFTELTYARVLRDSKEAFGVPDTLESLVEIALYRGKLRDTALWRSMTDWMPACVEHIMHHAVMSGEELEEYAREILDSPQNNRRIFTTACERIVIEEFIGTRNWRVAIGRAVSVIMTDVRNLSYYRLAIVYCTCLLALAHQLGELGALQRRTKLQLLEPKRIVRPSTPKKRKKPSPLVQTAKPVKQKAPPRAPKPPPVVREKVEKDEPETEGWAVVGAKGKPVVAEAKPEKRGQSLAEFILSETSVDFFNLQLGYTVFLPCAQTENVRMTNVWSLMPHMPPLVLQ